MASGCSPTAGVSKLAPVACRTSPPAELPVNNVPSALPLGYLASLRAAAVYAFARSRVKFAWAVANVVSQSTWLALPTFS
jgi:hypothetical protein